MTDELVFAMTGPQPSSTTTAEGRTTGPKMRERGQHRSASSGARLRTFSHLGACHSAAGGVSFLPVSEIKTRRIHEIKLDGDEGHVLVAFAKTDAVDEDEDYTFAGAFPSGKSVPIGAYSHNSWPHRGGLMPTGKGELKELGGWAVLDGKFFTDTTQGRDAYLTVKHMGPDQQWSYGYDVMEKSAPPPGVKAKRGLKSLDVHEVCPTLLGAQPLAHTMALKSFSSDASDAQYIMGSIARLIESESKRGSETDVAVLRGALETLKTYAGATISSIGTEEDLAEIAAERAMYKSLGLELPAGFSFAEMSDRLLADVEAFKSRAGAILTLRLKEGRAISSGRLELLQTHVDALSGAADTLKEMIEAAKPKPKVDPEAEGKLRRMRMEASLASAHLSQTH